MSPATEAMSVPMGSAGMRCVTLKLFEGSRHEFLNEREGREEKWGTVLAFFDRLAARQTAQ